MTIQYLTNQKGKKTGVLISIREWEKIERRLNRERFYDDFKTSLDAVKLDSEGKIELKDASDLFKGVGK